MSKIMNRKKGFSLTEILVSIGVFAIIVGAMSLFFVEALRYRENRALRINASLEMQEMLNAIYLNKDSLWLSMVENTNEGAKHIELQNDTYTIVDGASTSGQYDLEFSVGDVYRDSNGNIATSGTLDFRSRVINAQISWTDSFGIVTTQNLQVYLNNWNTPEWTQTTQAEFNNGTTTLNTLVTDRGGGAVELDLREVFQGDWCAPTQTVTTYNLSRQGVPTAISAVPNYAFLGTGENASGPDLEYVSISSTNPPVANQIGNYSNNLKSNDIYGASGYAYIATNTNNQEVSIVNVTSTPFTETGYFDASGNTDGSAVWVSGNIGYLVQGNRLVTFDLTSKSGSRPALGSINLPENGSDIVVNGNYAFITLTGTSADLTIIDVSNPTSMSILSNTNLNTSASRALYVSSDTNRVYLVTDTNASANEFYILNTSNKNAAATTIASVDSAGTSLKDISVIDDRAIVVGIGGTEYKVYNIEAEGSPTLCGSLNNDFGINGVETVIDQYQSAWAYVLTGDSNGELIMILGGPIGAEGGNGQGSQIVSYGEYTSQIFDTGKPSSYFYTLSWDEIAATGTNLRIRVRTSNDPSMSGASWVGPDGGTSTFFDNSSGEYLPQSLNQKRYFQYRLYFYSDEVNTPILENITLNYQ